MEPKQIELETRWENFLKQIEYRFNESLVYAEEACKSQLVETNFDYHLVLKTWMGIKSQLYQLTEKIDDTWDNQVKEQFYFNGMDSIDYELKGTHLSDQLLQQLKRFEIELQGKLSQQFYNHAIKLVDKDFNCSQCDATIQIQPNLFRAQYITCSFCNTVNTIEPEGQFLQIGYNVIDNIVAYKLIEEFDELEAIRNQLNSLPYHSIELDELWKKYEVTYIKYYEQFFTECIKLKPETKNRFEANMERKRKQLQIDENRYKNKLN